MTELEELRLAYAECSRQRNELLNKLKSHAQRKPLTYEQRQYIIRMWKVGNWNVGDCIDEVEAAHGIKEDA